MLPGTVMVLGSFFCGVCGQKPMKKTEKQKAIRLEK